MRLFLFFIVISLFWSCSSLKIEKASNNKIINNNSIVYRLPQNEINLIFTLSKSTFVPGPFSNYAQDFLELSPLKTKKETYWTISNVKTKTTAVEDTTQVYLLSGIDNITPSNLAQILNTQNFNYSLEDIENYTRKNNLNPLFPELTLKQLIIEDSKTSYKTVVVDSITKKVPVVNKVLRNKTTQELAKDAAKTITKIRKRKFRLMAGMNDEFPNKKALELMFNELDKKEKYYLELFMGKEITEEKTMIVSVLPKEYKTYTLFYFDKNKGIVKDESDGKAVCVNIEKTSQTPILNIETDTNTKKKSWPYRIAKTVKLNITYDNNKLLETYTKLAQFGNISYLPLKTLSKLDFKIDSKTGEVKGLE